MRGCYIFNHISHYLKYICQVISLFSKWYLRETSQNPNETSIIVPKSDKKDEGRKR